MYRYCVQIMPLLIGSYEMRTDNGRVAAFAARSTKIDTYLESLPRGDEAQVETWYAEDEERAKYIALHLAAQKPGRQVLIMELKHVANAGKPKVSVAAYSDRGLVPL